MENGITAFIVCDQTVDTNSAVWECLESCGGFCDRMEVNFISGDNGILDVILEFRRLKRDFSVSFYDSVDEAFWNYNPTTTWTMVLFADEVCHEGSQHFFWDLVQRHGDEYDFAMIPVRMVFRSDSRDSGRAVTFDDSRLIKSDVMKDFHWNGVEFDYKETFRIVPSSLCPKPIWKMRTSTTVNDGYGEYIPLDPTVIDVPAGIKRIVGRRTYTLPYLLVGD